MSVIFKSAIKDEIFHNLISLEMTQKLIHESNKLMEKLIKGITDDELRIIEAEVVKRRMENSKFLSSDRILFIQQIIKDFKRAKKLRDYYFIDINTNYLSFGEYMNLKKQIDYRKKYNKLHKKIR